MLFAFSFSLLINEISTIFPLMEHTFFSVYIKCRRGNKHFDVHLWRIRSTHFLSKDGKDASYEGKHGGKGCLFPARVGPSIFWSIYDESTFFYVYVDLACQQLCFPPGKDMKRRNKSTKEDMCYQFWVPTIISSIVDFLNFNNRNSKTQIDFPSEKRRWSFSRWSLLFL